MKENKNNELKKDSLEQVAGGGPGVEALDSEMTAMTAEAIDMVRRSREGLASGTVSLQEALDTLLEVSKMYKNIEEKAKQRADILFPYISD